MNKTEVDQCLKRYDIMSVIFHVTRDTSQFRVDSVNCDISKVSVDPRMHELLALLEWYYYEVNGGELTEFDIKVTKNRKLK